jgi:hypothetical protein
MSADLSFHEVHGHAALSLRFVPGLLIAPRII